MKALLAAILIIASGVTASAQTSEVPAALSYQGHVTDSSGTPIGAEAPTNRKVQFKFYESSSGGNPLYAEEQTVTLSGGNFSVLIGSGTGISGLPGPSAPAVAPYITLPSIAAGDLYLGITVDDGTANVDQEIAPRQQIVSAAYAFRSRVAERLVDGALITDMLADTAVTTNKIGAAQVTTAKIADANIITAKIADANVTTEKLNAHAVTTDKIANHAVTGDQIANNAINSARIADGTITSADIQDGTVNSADIQDGQVATADLANGSVTTAKLANTSVDLDKLIADVKNALCPPGSIMPFAGDTAPAGWILCDGGLINRTTYSALFSTVGTRFGYTANDNFRVPDLRGQFIRGRDGGAGRDEDRASRVAMNANGATGDAVGSIQGDNLRSHTHLYEDIYFSESGGNSTLYNNSIGSNKTDWDNEGYEATRTSHASGGNETRPENVNVNFIIKY